MREKLMKVPVAVTLLLSLVCTGIFVAILNYIGYAFGLIPAMADRSMYFQQAAAEFVILVIFLIIAGIFGQLRILQENKLGWLMTLYVGGFFVVYCFFAVISQVYVVNMTDVGPVKPVGEIISYVVACALVGIVEELVFRGVILNLLLDRFSKTQKGIVAAIILDGLIFGCMHYSNMSAGVSFLSVTIQVSSATMLGILFAFIYAYTRNFWAVAIFHAIIDFGALISTGIFSKGSMVDQLNTFGPINLIATAILLIPAIILLRKKNREKLELMYNGGTLEITEEIAGTYGVISMILGIVSLLFSCIGYLLGLGVIGIIAASISLKYKKQNNVFAILGIVLSIVGIVISILAILGFSYIYSNVDMSVFEQFTNL